MIAHNFTDPAELVKQYTDQVVAGERAAGRLERLAVERHVTDMETAQERGWYFDSKIARKSCIFFPQCLKHSIGEWAGHSFELNPWQAFVVWNIQGWRSTDDDTRRFRKAYITVGRKNGKTTWMAGFAALLLYADTPIESGGRGYCAATKRSQASLLWDETRRMIQQSYDLNKRTVITPSRYKIMVVGEPWNESTFEPLGADATRQDGLNPSFVIKDELHEWRRGQRALDEKLSTGGAARRQPLELIITTAGDDNSEIWAEEHEFASKVVAGGIDDTYFALICQADEDDDPLDKSSWQKANPNWGFSVKPKYIESQAAEAVNKPSAMNGFERYHLNRCTTSFPQAYPKELWDLGNQSFDDPVNGAICFGGMDLGRSDDWSAVSFVFPEFVDDTWHYKIISKTWAVEGQGHSKIPFDRDPWRTWIYDGILAYEKSEIMDFSELKAWVIEMWRKYQLKSLAYDKTFAHEIAASLYNDYGVPIFDYFQTHAKYTEPIKSFEHALRAGCIYHRGDPVLSWQAGNTTMSVRRDGKLMLDKGGAVRWKKVDAMVATMMAYSECIYASDKKQKGAVFITPGSGDVKATT